MKSQFLVLEYPYTHNAEQVRMLQHNAISQCNNNIINNVYNFIFLFRYFCTKVLESYFDEVLRLCHNGLSIALSIRSHSFIKRTKLSPKKGPKNMQIQNTYSGPGCRIASLRSLWKKGRKRRRRRRRERKKKIRVVE